MIHTVRGVGYMLPPGRLKRIIPTGDADARACLARTAEPCWRPVMRRPSEVVSVLALNSFLTDRLDGQLATASTRLGGGP